MAEINWGLVGRFDPVDSFLQGRRDRELFEKVTGRKRAGLKAAQGDYEGAAAEALGAGDIETGSRLYEIVTGRKRDERSQRQFDEQMALRRQEAERQNRQFQQSYGLQQRIAEQGRMPSGFERAPDGSLQPSTGGPADPSYQARLREAKGLGVEEAGNLRKEIRSLPSYKAMAEVAPRISSMWEATKRDDRAADVSLVFGLMKTLDPTSVVRESEVSMAQNIATLPEQYRAQVQSFLTGKGRLAPEVRQAIFREAYGAAKAYESQFERDIDQYRGIAQRGRVREEDVIPSFGRMPQGVPNFGAAGPRGDQPQPAPGGPSREEALAEARRRGLIP